MMTLRMDKLLLVLWIANAPQGVGQSVASSSSAGANAQTVPQALDLRSWLSDFEHLKFELERSYSHLAGFGSPEGGVDLPALNRVTLQAIRRAKTNTEAGAALLTFVSGFHDGHFALAPVPETTNAAHDPPQPAVASDAETACAAYGYAPRTSVQYSLPFESLASFTLHTDGLQEAFGSGVIESKGARFGIVRIPRFRPREFPTLCRQVSKALQSQGVPITARAIASRIDEVWLKTLAARLQSFRQEKVIAVIVDVGGNGGGTDLGDWAVRLFTGEPVRSAPLLLSAGKAAAPFFDEQIQVLQHALRSQDLPNLTQDALLGGSDLCANRRGYRIGG